MRRVLLAVGLAALGGSLPSPVDAQAPSFAGTWKLSEKGSDDPEKQFRLAMQRDADPVAARGFGRDRRQGGGGGTGGARRQPPAQGTGGAAGGGRPGSGACSPAARLRQPADELIIEQTDSTISVTGGRCPPGILYLDDRTTTETLPDGGVVTSVYAFKDGKLKVERKAGETLVRETYSLNEKKGQLVAEFLVNTPPMPNALRMKLAYDRQ